MACAENATAITRVDIVGRVDAGQADRWARTGQAWRHTTLAFLGGCVEPVVSIAAGTVETTRSVFLANGAVIGGIIASDASSIG